MTTMAMNTNVITELLYPKPRNKLHPALPKSHLQVLYREIAKTKLITE